MCFISLSIGCWVGDDASRDADTNRPLSRGMWRPRSAGVTSPFDLVSEQGQLDPIRSKLGVIRSDDLG
ncbi:hypothetical protein NL676_011896 [Syzygium grande]|nr:hypothetical protein NL676_011896 [Syzygium grande]